MITYEFSRFPAKGSGTFKISITERGDTSRPTVLFYIWLKWGSVNHF